MSNAHQALNPTSLSDLSDQLDLKYQGDAGARITSVSSFQSASSGSLCFLTSRRYLDALQASQCEFVIVPLDFDVDALGEKNGIFSPNPHLSFVQAIDILCPESLRQTATEIHPSACIAESASMGKGVSIGAGVDIGEQVTIGDDVTIGAGSIIEDHVQIESGCLLHSKVTLCHRVKIGHRSILHSGVVIGSDGFGLVPDSGQWHKIPHLGSVIIGDDVEIGANTTVDRGALDDTVIEKGVKLDNLIQVAHNVRIGENTAIAACVGIAGSAVIGKNCQISGAAVILGHLSVADNVTVTAMSLVTKSIKQSGTYSSGTPLLENRLWHRNNARYKALDSIARSVSDLEKKLK
jgi:UDP-3-O-[3-hydroxymyristoyl] glucosamine N-acyltransferase